MTPNSTLFETSLVSKELKDVTEKHVEVVKQIKEITEVLRVKNDELNRLKEHGLIVTGAKAILESMQKTIQDQVIESDAGCSDDSLE